MRITLVRHGKPIVPSLKRVSAPEFSEWVDTYNHSGLCPSSEPPTQLVDYSKTCKAIVCSGLPRSIESTKALKATNIIISDAIFNEADMPTANWRFLRFSPKVWAVIFRVLWFLGYSNNAESFKEAKKRAVMAVEKLTEIAQEHESVLLVGHGVYNRILANELKKTGWKGPQNPGSKYWSMGTYQCEKHSYHHP